MSLTRKFILFGCISSLLFLAVLILPATAQTINSRPPSHAQNEHPAQPGSINYVEGQASIDGQPLSTSSVGSAVLDRGQTLTTQDGKVEVLLTPGVFLRVSNSSAVKMVSPDLANTEVQVDQGEAMVEVNDISKNNDIRVDEHGANAQLLKKGLYDFDAQRDQIRVFKGKAQVVDNDRKVSLGDNRELALSAVAKLKSQHFDTKQYAGDLYRWSGLRSGYLAEADADTAQLYVNGGTGWLGSGWYWDPWFGAYTFIPGDGIFYSPFGWGFYSPFAVWGSPFFYGGWGGYYGHPHRFGEFHGPYGHGFEPSGGFGGRGFGGGSHGGFRSGGGGFHGGAGGRR